jgi:hypothetical protein
MAQTCTNFSFYILIATSYEKYEKILKIFLGNFPREVIYYEYDYNAL